MEIRDEQKQTPHTTPPIFSRIGLSSEKAPVTELAEPTTPSHSSSHHAKHIRGAVAKISNTFEKGSLSRGEEATDSIVKANLQRIIREEMHKETTSVKDDFRSLITTKLATTAPGHIEEFL
ncbi:hypothetical protein Tco_0210447 [Tanacetum coccineum]